MLHAAIATERSCTRNYTGDACRGRGGLLWSWRLGWTLKLSGSWRAVEDVVAVEAVVAAEAVVVAMVGVCESCRGREGREDRRNGEVARKVVRRRKLSPVATPSPKDAVVLRKASTP